MKLNEQIGTLLISKGCRVISVDPADSIREAIETMSQYEVGALLVIANGKLEGIFSERDYARKVILEGRTSRDTTVGEVMTRNVVTVPMDHTIDECMRLMTANRIRHLPVVQEDKVVGVVSIGDLVKWTISVQEETIHQLQHYIAGAYPA